MMFSVTFNSNSSREITHFHWEHTALYIPRKKPERERKGRGIQLDKPQAWEKTGKNKNNQPIDQKQFISVY